MELSNENIDRLIVRYLSGNLELQDKRVLETWISNNQDNYDYFLKMNFDAYGFKSDKVEDGFTRKTCDTHISLLE